MPGTRRLAQTSLGMAASLISRQLCDGAFHAQSSGKRSLLYLCQRGFYVPEQLSVQAISQKMKENWGIGLTLNQPRQYSGVKPARGLESQEPMSPLHANKE